MAAPAPAATRLRTRSSPMPVLRAIEDRWRRRSERSGPPGPTEPPRPMVSDVAMILRGADRVGMYPERMATAAIASGTPSPATSGANRSAMVQATRRPRGTETKRHHPGLTRPRSPDRVRRDARAFDGTDQRRRRQGRRRRPRQAETSQECGSAAGLQDPERVGPSRAVFEHDLESTLASRIRDAGRRSGRRSDEFDDRHLGAVTAARADPDDPGVAAGACRRSGGRSHRRGW